MDMNDIFLVSSCLVGINCRYNGKNKFNTCILKFLKDRQFLPLCPEQLGGLPTPREPSFFVNGDGFEVLRGKTTVIDSVGRDVTENFIKGAKETLSCVKRFRINKAIMKDRSPSCGVTKTLNTTNGIVSGVGVTTALLVRNGVKVFSEKNFNKS